MSSERMMTLHDIITALFIIPVIFNVEMFKEYIGYWLVVFTIRTIVINITILPKDKKCDIVKHSSPYVGGCYDKVYSGHFAVFFTCLLFLYKKKYINMFIFALSSIIMGTLIVASRSHYTIDVIVSFLIVLVFYQNNISACRIIDKYIK